MCHAAGFLPRARRNPANDIVPCTSDPARSTSDRRVVHIELTPAGVAVAERVPHILCDVYNQVLVGFSPQEWAQLKTMLTRLTQTAQALSAPKDAS